MNSASSTMADSVRLNSATIAAFAAARSSAVAAVRIAGEIRSNSAAQHGERFGRSRRGTRSGKVGARQGVLGIVDQRLFPVRRAAARSPRRQARLPSLK